jgi:hypothetical protein
MPMTSATTVSRRWTSPGAKSDGPSAEGHGANGDAERQPGRRDGREGHRRHDEETGRQREE